LIDYKDSHWNLSQCFKMTLTTKISLPVDQWVRVRVIVFNATFNNISDISWWSVLLVEENRV